MEIKEGDILQPRLSLDRELLGDFAEYWRWMLAFGVVSVLLGIFGFGMAAFLSVASALVFGILLVAGGGLQLLQSFKCRGWKSTLPHILIALVYFAIGFIMIVDPVGAAVALTLVLGMALFIVGFLRIGMALQHRGMSGWGWVLAAGIATLVLGLLVILGWPETGLWVIGLFVAVELIINGWSAVLFALTARRVEKEAREESA